MLTTPALTLRKRTITLLWRRAGAGLPGHIAPITGRLLLSMELLYKRITPRGDRRLCLTILRIATMMVLGKVTFPYYLVSDPELSLRGSPTLSCPPRLMGGLGHLFGRAIKGL
ncbi:hypothetical protein [Limosilactobacillus fermentum]|uniref:hypothetical protein n=1 Tax=Limosilactobacillus fermentum TaxID=1613 RepID=UPI0012D4027D|nr:hypothetical protein [Limosilactobacillus fermentum]